MVATRRLWLSRWTRRVNVPVRIAASLVLVALVAWVVRACDEDVRELSFVEAVSRRSYRVVVRDDHDRTRPTGVLFALHAYATAPELLVNRYRLIERAVAWRGLMLVVPEGKRDQLGNLSWNASKACCGRGERANDLAYLRGVLSDLRKRFAVDGQRVFAIGVSNGGFMAHRWACEPGGDLVAIVSIAGAAPGPDDPPCAPSRPVSVLQVHGAADEVIEYAGGARYRERYPSARESVLTWVERNEMDPRAFELTYGRSIMLESIRRETWRAKRGTRVALWSVDGGDHLLRSMWFEAGEMIQFLQ
jgi:polyhydroxybutyrate depolymerase